MLRLTLLKTVAGRYGLSKIRTYKIIKLIFRLLLCPVSDEILKKFKAIGQIFFKRYLSIIHLNERVFSNNYTI